MKSERKLILLTVLVFITLQTLSPQDKTLPWARKEVTQSNIKYIVIFRNLQQNQYHKGATILPREEWITQVSAFESIDQILQWLNGKDWKGRQKARLSSNQLIAIYILDPAKRIEARLNSVERTLPRRVEYQEERWTESYWEIKE